MSAPIVKWPTGGRPWTEALTLFAQTPQPRINLPSGIYLRSDSHTLAIHDGYPKARFHFLVLPRIPFFLQDYVGDKARTSSTGTRGSNEKPSLPLMRFIGRRLSSGSPTLRASAVPGSHLHSLTSLLASSYATEVLSKMRVQGEAVSRLIKAEMKSMTLPGQSEPCNVTWGVRMGFHAVPSMDTVHLHVISDDLVSDRLKHKKHYQSFHPRHGFWIELDQAEALARQEKGLPHSRAHYEQLLKAPLVSFRNGQTYPNMPKLKTHLQEAWLDSLKRRGEVVNDQPAEETTGTLPR